MNQSDVNAVELCRLTGLFLHVETKIQFIQFETFTTKPTLVKYISMVEPKNDCHFLPLCALTLDKTEYWIDFHVQV